MMQIIKNIFFGFFFFTIFGFCGKVLKKYSIKQGYNSYFTFVCDVEQPWLEKNPTILGVYFALLCVAKQPWLQNVLT